MNWHSIPKEEIVKILKSNLDTGLSSLDVKNRTKEFGLNKISEESRISALKIFFEQFKSPLIFILVIAGTITLFLNIITDAVVIFAAVFLNVIVGFIQEYKASKTLRALKKVVKHEAEVLRDGNLKIINSIELVCGDIIFLNPGDRVPADGRIIESHNLKIDEMALTGEWLPAIKTTDILPEKTPMADRDNMVFMGTIVEDGKAKFLVTEIGISSEIGKISKFIKEIKEEKTPYQIKLANFSKKVSLVIAFLCFLVFALGINAGLSFVEMFTTVVAVAVSAIPEGLPVAITVILALGMQKVLKKKGLIRKLNSAETLGSTSIICTDKTATLTEGKMQVSGILVSSQILNNKENKDAEILTLKGATLCSEAFIENINASKEKWILRGKPTDKALLFAGAEAGIFKQKELRIDNLSFDPVFKYSATLYKLSEKDKNMQFTSDENKRILYVLGAPEKILEKSLFFLNSNGEISNLDKVAMKKLELQFNTLTGKGLRVLSVAYRLCELENNEIKRSMVEKLIFVGFISLKDPIRKSAKESVELCRQAGIRLIIVTGDHKLTAKSVAQDLGFKINKDNILEGNDLDNLDDSQFFEILEKIKIYARLEPRHKIRIVNAWQEKGEVVAMTGDGINDAPALKKADIGIALGSGTEVAKEASDLVLLNNDFSIIVSAIEQGRVIVDNIRKVITYLLSNSFTEVILISVSILAGVPLPVTAAQILWINLIEDGLPDIALAFEPGEKNVMKQKPLGHNIPLLTKEMKIIIFIISFITDLILLVLLFWLWNNSHDTSYIRTMIFACLTIDSLFYVFSCKSLKQNLWEIDLLSNKFLIGAWVLGVFLFILAIYLPILQMFLKTVPLALNDWLIILSIGIIQLILIEITKWHFIIKKKFN